jgi:glyoxylase-like metal-dependent hydrolase (beta-lactamase superfamily II)
MNTAILSHLHQDHIGGLPELTGADLLVPADERGEPPRPGPERRGFPRSHIQLPGLRWHQVTMEQANDRDLAPFTQPLDVMGTGRWSCCPLPGTRPDRCHCWVRRTGKPPPLLTGDLAYHADFMPRGQLPGVGCRRQLAESTRDVLPLAGKHPGLVVPPAHDPAAARRLLAS